MSESVIVTTVQQERIKRDLADIYTALTTARRHLSELEETLAGLEGARTMTGSIQGLPGTVTITGYEGGWAHVGDGVMVKEEHGKPVPAITETS